jgi:hypothetical protein
MKHDKVIKNVQYQQSQWFDPGSLERKIRRQFRWSNYYDTVRLMRGAEQMSYAPRVEQRRVNFNE